MRYKTSCFNPTLWKHNLRRFWPLVVLIFGLVLVAVVMPYCSSMEAGGIYDTALAGDELTPAEKLLIRQRRAAFNFGDVLVFLQFLCGMAGAMLVMHHIHGRKQLQFYHALPVSRRCLYGTAVVSGYTLALVPQLLAELIMMGKALSVGAELWPLGQLMAVTVVAFTLFFALSMLACTLAGQTFGALCLYIGINFLVLAIAFGGIGIAGYLLPGYSGYLDENSFVMWLTPLLRLMEDGAVAVYDEAGLYPIGFQWSTFVVYGLVGLGVLVGTGFLYQHRKGEMAGEMVAYSFLREMCTVAVALVVGFGGTVCLVMTMNTYKDISNDLICLMVVGMTLLGWVATEMVIRKSLKVWNKKALFRCMSLLVVVLVVLVGARLDVLGYVNRTPDLTRVASVSVSQTGEEIWLSPTDGLALHQQVLDNRQELSNNTSYMSWNTISLNYFDEDGETVMERSYYISGDGQGEILSWFFDLMDQPEYNAQSWFSWQQGILPEEAIRTVELNADYRYDDEMGRDFAGLLRDGNNLEYGYQTLTVEEGKALYRAILQDIQDGNMSSTFRRNYGTEQIEYGYLQIQAYLELPEKGRTESQSLENGNTYYYVAITEEMRNTLSALDEMGITINPEYVQQDGDFPQTLIPATKDVPVATPAE